MSVKLDLKPSELANKTILKKQFKKIRSYYDKFFLNLDDNGEDEDSDDNVIENEI